MSKVIKRLITSSIALVSILSIILCFTSNANVNKEIVIEDLTNLDKELREVYKEEYPYILCTDYRKVGEIYKVKPYMFTGLDENLFEIKGKGSTYAIINEIITELSSIRYSTNQSDPNKMKELGGNCQAFALTINYFCDKYGVENRFIVEPNHIYNIVVIDGEEYKLDMTTKEFNLVE